MIREGSLVRFEYTLSDENGELIQSNKGKEPVSYTHGKREIIPGLEKGLTGMEINEEKSLQVEPQDAFGSVDPNNFKEVPKSDVPEAALSVGAPLGAQGPNGEKVVIYVHEVKEKSVVLDFNHPLAGKTLQFEIKVLEVEPKEA